MEVDEGTEQKLDVSQYRIAVHGRFKNDSTCTKEKLMSQFMCSCTYRTAHHSIIHGLARAIPVWYTESMVVYEGAEQNLDV